MQTLVVAAMLIVAALSAFGGSYLQKRSFSSDERSLAYYRETHLRKQGYSRGFGQYELLSFDGGKRWYAVEQGRNDEIIIRGTAEEVFPGLLAHLHGWDALIKHAVKNGPLTLSGERAETDRTLLESAGFTVTKK